MAAHQAPPSLGFSRQALAKIQNTPQMLTRKWSNGYSSHSLLMRMQNGRATLENNLKFLTKLNILYHYDPKIALLGIYSNELKTYTHTNLHMDVYSTFIYNCQNVEATKTSSHDKTWRNPKCMILRSPGEGNGNILQYSCLGNSMNRGAWQSI